MMKGFYWIFALVTAILMVFQAGIPVPVFAQNTSASADMEEISGMEDISLGELLNIKYIETATKHLMETRKAPAIATVITADEIRNMGARDLKDVLRTVPGFGPRKRAVVQTVTVRGVSTPTTEKILLLIDGHRMNTPYDGSALRFFSDDLMVENIKRVEVIRGPGSALYGANAFCAVINVITKTAEDIDSQQISISGGSFDTGHFNGLFSHKDKESGFEISGHLDYQDTDGQDNFIEQDGQTFYDRKNGTDVSSAPGCTDEYVQKWDAGFRVRYGDFNLSSRVIEKEYGTTTGAIGALNDESYLEVMKIFGDLAWTKRLGDNLNMTVNLYADYFDVVVFWERQPAGFTGENDIGKFDKHIYKNAVFGGEITTDYTLGDHFITTGLVYEYTKQYDVRHFNNFADYTAGMAETTDHENNIENVDRNIWAAYLQNVWEITAYDSLTLGVRYDRYDDFGGTLNPRLGFVHEFGNDLVMKILYGSAFRAPTFIELYTNYTALAGNPDIEPEKISTYEVGLEYPFLKHYTIKLSYFHNEIEDLITRGPTPMDGGPTTFINKTGKTRVNGGEAELVFKFAKDKYGYINGSYQYARDENNKEFPEVPRWIANAGLNYGFSKYLNANVNVSWLSERPRAENDALKREELSSETLVDLTLIAKGFCKNLEIAGSVHNLFDEDYRDPQPGVLIPNDIPTNKRTFLFEIRYKF